MMVAMQVPPAILELVLSQTALEASQLCQTPVVQALIHNEVSDTHKYEAFCWTGFSRRQYREEYSYKY